MPGFTESNITLNFPDNNFFRLASCRVYTRLSGYHFKEMDACWYEVNQNLYWLIELKDFTAANISTSSTILERALDLVKKAVDSLCMFLSAKHAYPYALAELNPCLPTPVPNANTQFKVVVIIRCDLSQKTNIPLINEQFKRRFRPYAELFGINHYAVMEHSSAIRIIPNSMVQ